MDRYNNITSWQPSIEDPPIEISKIIDRLKLIQNDPDQSENSLQYDMQTANNTYSFKDSIDTAIKIIETSYYHDMMENDYLSRFFYHHGTTKDLRISNGLAQEDDPMGRTISPNGKHIWFEYKFELNPIDSIFRDIWKRPNLENRWLTQSDLEKYHFIHRNTICVFLNDLLITDIEIKIDSIGAGVSDGTDRTADPNTKPIPAYLEPKNAENWGYNLTIKFPFDPDVYKAIYEEKHLPLTILKFQSREYVVGELSYPTIVQNGWKLSSENYPIAADALKITDNDLIVLLMAPLSNKYPSVTDPNLKRKLLYGPQMNILHLKVDEKGLSYIDLNDLDQHVKDWMNRYPHIQCIFSRPNNMWEYPKLITKNQFIGDTSEKDPSGYNSIYDYIVFDKTLDQVGNDFNKFSPVDEDDIIVVKQKIPDEPTADPWYDQGWKPSIYKVARAYPNTYAIFNSETDPNDIIEYGKVGRGYYLVKTDINHSDSDPNWGITQFDMIDHMPVDNSPNCRVYYFTKTKFDNLDLDPIVLKAIKCARKYLFSPYNYIEPYISNLYPGEEVTIREFGLYDVPYIVCRASYPLDGKTMLVRKNAMSSAKMNKINRIYANELFDKISFDAGRFFQDCGDVPFFYAYENTTLTPKTFDYFDDENHYLHNYSSYEDNTAERVFRFFDLSVMEVNNVNPFASNSAYSGSNLRYGQWLNQIFPNQASRICYNDDGVAVKWKLRDESRRVTSYKNSLYDINRASYNPSYFVVNEDGSITDQLDPNTEIWYRPCILLDDEYDFERWNKCDGVERLEGIKKEIPSYLYKTYLHEYDDQRLLRVIKANGKYFRNYLNLLFPTDTYYGIEKFYKYTDDNAYYFDKETWFYPFDYVSLKMKNNIHLYPDNFIKYLEMNYNEPFVDWKLRIMKDLDISEYKRYYTNDVFVYTDFLDLTTPIDYSEFTMFPGKEIKLKDLHVWREYDVWATGNGVEIYDNRIMPVFNKGRRLIEHEDDSGIVVGVDDDGNTIFGLDRDGNKIWRVDIQIDDGSWINDVQDPEYPIKQGLRLYHLPTTIFTTPGKSSNQFRDRPNYATLFPGMDTSLYGPYPIWDIPDVMKCSVHYEFPTLRDNFRPLENQQPTEIIPFDQPQFVLIFNNYAIRRELIKSADDINDTENNTHIHSRCEITYVPFLGGFEYEYCKKEIIEQCDYVRYPYNEVYNLKGSSTYKTAEHNKYFVITKMTLNHPGTNYFAGEVIFIDIRKQIRIGIVVKTVNRFGEILEWHLFPGQGDDKEFKNFDPAGNNQPAIPDQVQRVDNKYRHGVVGNSSGTIDEVQDWYDNNGNIEWWDVATFDIETEMSREEWIPGESYQVEVNNTFIIRKLFNYDYTQEFTLPNEKFPNGVIFHPHLNEHNEIHLEDVSIFNKDTGKYEPFDIAGGQPLYTLNSITPRINDSIQYYDVYKVDNFRINEQQLCVINPTYNIGEFWLKSLRPRSDIKRRLTVTTLEINLNAVKLVSHPITILGIEPIIPMIIERVDDTLTVPDTETLPVSWWTDIGQPFVHGDLNYDTNVLNPDRHPHLYTRSQIGTDIYDTLSDKGLVSSADFRAAWGIPATDILDYNQRYTYTNRQLQTTTGITVGTCTIELEHFDYPVRTDANIIDPLYYDNNVRDRTYIRIVAIYDFKSSNNYGIYTAQQIEVSPDSTYNSDEPEIISNYDGSDYRPNNLISYKAPPIFANLPAKLKNYPGIHVEYADGKKWVYDNATKTWYDSGVDWPYYMEKIINVGMNTTTLTFTTDSGQTTTRTVEIFVGNEQPDGAGWIKHPEMVGHRPKNIPGLDKFGSDFLDYTMYEVWDNRYDLYTPVFDYNNNTKVTSSISPYNVINDPAQDSTPRDTPPSVRIPNPLLYRDDKHNPSASFHSSYKDVNYDGNVYNHYSVWYRFDTVSLLGKPTKDATMTVTSLEKNTSGWPNKDWVRIMDETLIKTWDYSDSIKNTITTQVITGFTNAPQEYLENNDEVMNQYHFTVELYHGSTTIPSGQGWYRYYDTETDLYYWTRIKSSDVYRFLFFPFVTIDDISHWQYKQVITNHDWTEYGEDNPIKIRNEIYGTKRIDGIVQETILYNHYPLIILLPVGQKPINPIASNGFPWIFQITYDETYDIYLSCNLNEIKSLTSYTTPTSKMFELYFLYDIAYLSFLFEVEYLRLDYKGEVRLYGSYEEIIDRSSTYSDLTRGDMVIGYLTDQSTGKVSYKVGIYNGNNATYNYQTNSKEGLDLYGNLYKNDSRYHQYSTNVGFSWASFEDLYIIGATFEVVHMMDYNDIYGTIICDSKELYVIKTSTTPLHFTKEKYFHRGMNEFLADIVDTFKDNIIYIPIKVWISNETPPFDEDDPYRIWYNLTERFYDEDNHQYYNCKISYHKEIFPIDISRQIKDWWHLFIKDEYNIIQLGSAGQYDIFYDCDVSMRRDKRYNLDVYVWPKESKRELNFGLSYSDVSYQLRINGKPGNYEIRIHLDPEQADVVPPKDYRPEATVDRKMKADRIYLRKRSAENTTYRVPFLAASAMTYLYNYSNTNYSGTELNPNSGIWYEGTIESDWDLVVQTLPYPIKAMWAQRRLEPHGYFDFMHEILNKRWHRSQMGHNRYEFFVNGRLLTHGDQYHMITPSKIFCHGLTSLRNAEIVEINREPYRELYVPETLKNILDILLEGFVVNHTYDREFKFYEQEDFITNEIWRQVDTDNPLFVLYPTNHNYDWDIRRFRNQNQITDDDGPFEYLGVVLDPAVIEAVPMVRDTRWGLWGYPEDLNHQDINQPFMGKYPHMAMNVLYIQNDYITAEFHRIMHDYYVNPLFMHKKWEIYGPYVQYLTEEQLEDQSNMQVATSYLYKTKKTLQIYPEDIVNTLLLERDWVRYENSIVLANPYVYNNPYYTANVYDPIFPNWRWAWKGYWKQDYTLYHWQSHMEPDKPWQLQGNKWDYDTDIVYNETDPNHYWSYPYDNGILGRLPDGRWYPWFNRGNPNQIPRRNYYWDDDIYLPGKPLIWEAPSQVRIYKIDDSNRSNVTIYWTKPFDIMKKETVGIMGNLLIPYTIRIYDETNGHVLLQEIQIDDWNTEQYTGLNLSSNILYSIRIDSYSRAGFRSGVIYNYNKQPYAIIN